MIRELLFMLRGSASTIFAVQDDAVEISRDVLMVHLSPLVVKNILNAFAQLGTDLRTLRRWITGGATVRTTRNSFLHAIGKHIMKPVECKLVELEMRYQSLRLSRKPEFASLLQLHKLLAEDVLHVQYAISVVERIADADVRADVDAKLVLDTTSRCLVELEYQQDHVLLEKWWNVSLDAMESYLTSLGQWINEGVMEDPLSEFFVARLVHYDVAGIHEHN